MMQECLCAAVQMNSCDDPKLNLQRAGALIQQAADQGVQWLVLPEMFACMTAPLSEQLRYAEVFGSGPVQDFLAQQSAQHKLWLIGGTLPLRSEQPDRAYASCLLYNPQGECISRYDKMHLFDVHISSSREDYRESDVFCRGRELACVDTTVAQCALAVCYDLRFPEMFRRLSNLGMHMVALPAAFTYTTGKAHWETLLRARAIENQVYIIAANQVGRHVGGRRTYGHSMVVSPWGEVLSRVADQPSLAVARIDFQMQAVLRDEFPCLKHRVFDTGE